MKLTKSQLKQIIKEEILVLELFDTRSAGEVAGAMSNEEKKKACETDENGRPTGREWVEGVGCDDKIEPVQEEDDKWIQGAEKDIEKRGTEGVCTGDKFGGPSCRPGTKRYNLAKTFRKMAKQKKK